MLEKELTEAAIKARAKGKYDTAALLEELAYQIKSLGRLDSNLVKGFPWRQ